MPKMIVSIDGVVIKEVQISKDKTTLGRRPYNDIVIDNLAVSGEHAVLQMSGSQVFLEDLNSTNGTYVNGKVVKRQQLQNGDMVEVGKYSIKFVSDAAMDAFDKTLVFKPGSGGLTPASSHSGAAEGSFSADFGSVEPLSGVIKVLSGVAAGREMLLTKVVTTVGKPGVAVAAITRRQRGFFVHHVEGGGNPMLNGSSIGSEPISLKNGDLIELAGTKMQFIQS
jgi:pSer/pThr/pTyr-binding forkhead associated (FHA) protein